MQKHLFIKKTLGFAIFLSLFKLSLTLYQDIKLDIKMGLSIRKINAGKSDSEIVNKFYFFVPMLTELKNYCIERNISTVKFVRLARSNTLQQRFSEMIVPVMIDRSATHSLVLWRAGENLLLRLEDETGKTLFQRSHVIPSTLRKIVSNS